MTAKTSDNTDNRDSSHTKSSYYRRKRELFGGMFGSVTGEVTITDSTVRRLLVKTEGGASIVGGFVGNAEATVTTSNCAVINSYVKDANAEMTFVNCSVLNGTVNGAEGTFASN